VWGVLPALSTDCCGEQSLPATVIQVEIVVELIFATFFAFFISKKNIFSPPQKRGVYLLIKTKKKYVKTV
jgi:hypothetical protein